LSALKLQSKEHAVFKTHAQKVNIFHAQAPYAAHRSVSPSNVNISYASKSIRLHRVVVDLSVVKSVDWMAIIV